LKSYVNDSICGTWELLADAIYPGGHKTLENKKMVGAEKLQWAEKIAPQMDVERNYSPSFNNFRTKLEELAKEHT